MGFRSGIRDPGFGNKPIPDPGSRGQKGNGSRIQIRNTATRAHAARHECVRCTGKSTGSRIRIHNTAAQVHMMHGMDVCGVQVHATIDLVSEPSLEYNKECSRWQNLICTEHCTL